MDSLEQRLSALEELVGSTSLRTTASSQDVNSSENPGNPFVVESASKVLASLQERVALLESPELFELRQKLSQVENLLSAGSGSSLDVLMSSQAKAEVIISAEADLKKTAHDLEVLSNLMPYVDQPSLSASGLRSHAQDIKVVEHKYFLTEQDIISQTAQIDKLLSDYKATMDMISESFVQWDKTASNSS
eukprot:GILI01038515.1.p1 GENE.GILI01038515.1~~GILI01038515.1.p1  ORF type:complete len:202 (-),score=20.46 GILI01038515.1:32-601(-)